MKKSTARILQRLFEREGGLNVCRESLEKAFSLMHDCFSQGRKILTCGNGGSASDSEHIVGELMKSFARRRPITESQRAALKANFPADYDTLADRLEGALPAISLVSHTALCTALSNDVSADMIFAQQVFGYGQEGDLLIAISTSGRSLNVVNAAKTARAFGLASIGLTGESESLISDLCTTTVRVPARETAEVQEYHLKVYHALCAMIEAEFFGDE